MVDSKLCLAALVAVVLTGCCCPRTCAPKTRSMPLVRPAPAEETAPTVAAAKETLPTADMDTVIALSKKRIKGLQWESTSLTSAVTYLRIITGLEFHVTPRVMEEKHEDIVIDMALDGVTVDTVLGLITEPFGLRWETRDGAIWILTTEEIDGPLQLRFFDLRGLIRPTEAGGYASMDEAIAVLERDVFPKYWARDDVALEGRNHILTVRASRAVHDAIKRALADERARLTKPALEADLEETLADIVVAVSISEQPMSDVVKTLQIQTGLNLMIDPRVAADVTAPVTLELRDTPMTTVLDAIATQAGEDFLWVGRGTVVMLTRREFTP